MSCARGARRASATSVAASSRAPSALLVPLVFRDLTYGLLAAPDRVERSEFSSEDERLLVAFATSAASAIATARSVERGLLRRSIQALEGERRRWAEEINARTLERLSRMRAELAAARAGDAPGQLDGVLDATLQELGEQIDALGWIITQLRPPELDEAGIAASLQPLFVHAGLTGLAVDAQIDLAYESGRAPTRLSAAIEVTVFRVVQEALDNAIQHGGARCASVLLTERDDELTLRVHDEGRGFDAAAQSDGYGFVDMRQRLAFVDGTLEIASEPGAGTTVTARVPVRRAE
jgi:signal transduction histidine kinase